MRIASIRAFISAFTNRSLTRASMEANLSQPALTKMMQALESELGVKLFTRGPRGIEPTEYAELFAPRAKRILAELNAASGEFEALASGRTGRLRVGSDSYVASEILPTATTRLLRDLPDLKIEIVTATSDQLAESMDSGEIDFLVTSVSRSARLSGLTTIELFQEDYAVVARADHPLARKEIVRFSDLSGYPWVHVGENFLSSSNIVPIMERERVALPTHIVATDSLAYLIAHLLRSDSLSYQPRRVLENARICALNIEGAPRSLSRFKVIAAHRADKTLSRAARQLLAYLRASPGSPDPRAPEGG